MSNPELPAIDTREPANASNTLKPSRPTRRQWTIICATLVAVAFWRIEGTLHRLNDDNLRLIRVGMPLDEAQVIVGHVTMSAIHGDSAYTAKEADAYAEEYVWLLWKRTLSMKLSRTSARAPWTLSSFRVWTTAEKPMDRW
jgi:hypothetical protein